MKFIDLFAGIGGFHLGMEKAGHECVGWVEWDKFARQSYIAVHDGAENLWNEKDVNDVKAFEMPKADIWCFGFPCQDISVAGKQGGFTNGKRSSLFFTVAGLLRELSQEDKPRYLLIENVKNLLSINKGWDFAKLQIELDEIGYDVEWSVLDSAEVVPQHRERIYIIGHLRGASTRKVFPIRRENGGLDSTADTRTVRQVGNLTPSGSFNGNSQTGRVYATTGIAPTLSTMQGGGQEPKVVLPTLTPDRINKRQNGRRFKDNGEPMFTLTLQDRHGVLVREATKKGYDIAKIGDSINISQPNSKTRRGRVGHGVANTLVTSAEQATLTSDYRIRKLTPRETWRLQAFPDELFDKAQQAGLSDSQLYKQAGNSVTVDVVYEIAKKLGE